MVLFKNTKAKFGVFDEKTCFFNVERLSAHLRFHLRNWHIWGNLEANVGQKAQTGFWKTVKKCHFLSLFLVTRPFEDFVRLLPLIGYGISKRAIFDKKDRKLMKNEWFSEPLLWDSAHKPRIHLFRSFSTFNLWHSALYVQKPCVFRVFSCISRVFWETRLDFRPWFGAGGGTIGGEVTRISYDR